MVFGNSVLGWPLGGGDLSYFAIKIHIRGAGVWFEDYDSVALASGCSEGLFGPPWSGCDDDSE